MHTPWLRFLTSLALVVPLLTWTSTQAEAGAAKSQTTAGHPQRHAKSRTSPAKGVHTARTATRHTKSRTSPTKGAHTIRTAARHTKHARHTKLGSPKVAAVRGTSHRSRRHSAPTAPVRIGGHLAKATPASRVAAGSNAGKHGRMPLRLESGSVLVVDDQGRPVFSKAEDEVRPIASITKLMTAMVVLDAGLPLDEAITISKEDSDNLRHSRSRLRLGKATLTRGEMLKIALMSSENRAAAALGRTTFPSGPPTFVAAMNRKAHAIGMSNSRFADPTGLQAANVSTAADLVKMVRAAGHYPLIRAATTTPSAEVRPHPKGGALHYVNTNRLVKNQDDDWEIHLSKTGFINEAGRCLVMEAKLSEGTYDFVLLNAPGKFTPIGDSNRLRRWIGSNGG